MSLDDSVNPIASFELELNTKIRMIKIPFRPKAKIRMQFIALKFKFQTLITQPGHKPDAKLGRFGI